MAKDARVFASTKLATLGAKTAAALQEHGIRPDFVPTVFTGRELGTQLAAFTNLHAKKVLLLRSELATPDLAEVLQQAGADVRDVPLYTAVPHTGDAAVLQKRIRGGHIHWVTFASPSAVQNFFEAIPPDTVNSSTAKVASIGPVTSSQLERLGVRVDLTASEHTTDGLLDAIENAESA
jgi:uroporphyrinogen-III synthase